MVLVWQEQPDVLVAASGLGITFEELAAAAESVTAISDEEWSRLPHPALGPPPETTPRPIASNELRDIGGVGWVNAEADGRVCVHIDTPYGVTDDCVSSGDAPLIRVRNTGRPGLSEAVVWGVVPNNVDLVRVEFPSGNATESSSTEVSGRGYRIVGFSLQVADPSALQVSSANVILLDANVSEVGRISAPVS